jgi:hypothetical protein
MPSPEILELEATGEDGRRWFELVKNGEYLMEVFAVGDSLCYLDCCPQLSLKAGIAGKI